MSADILPFPGNRAEEEAPVVSSSVCDRLIAALDAVDDTEAACRSSGDDVGYTGYAMLARAALQRLTERTGASIARAHVKRLLDELHLAGGAA